MGQQHRARIEQTEFTLSIYADDDFKLKQVMDVFTGKCAKRGVDVRALEPKEIEKISGDKIKQTVEVAFNLRSSRARRQHQFFHPARQRLCEYQPGLRRK